MSDLFDLRKTAADLIAWRASGFEATDPTDLYPGDRWDVATQPERIISLLDRIEALEAELEHYRRIPHSPIPMGSATLSGCGCHSWTDGFGNTGEWRCPSHAVAEARRPDGQVSFDANGSVSFDATGITSQDTPQG
jgi:hypothetical protein